MKPRDIFTLAVRILGLYFLCLGLKTVAPLIDLGAIEMASKSDIINALLPVLFNLVVAWWLLSNNSLARLAYPEASKISEHFPAPSSPAKPATPAPEPAASPELTNLEQAEKRLAALVEKPKDDRAK